MYRTARALVDSFALEDPAELFLNQLIAALTERYDFLAISKPS